MAGRLLIVGASGRAAAASALRAGFEPFVLDLFADADTERLCPVLKLPAADYPHGFVALAERVPPMPWLYTGGLENYPKVVAAISATRELWGNGPDVLAKVRDLSRLAEVFKERRPTVFLPRQFRPDSHATPEVRWLRKPRRGSGGSGIRFATPADLAAPDADTILQEYLDGDPLSMTLLNLPNSTDCLGLTRQLIGVPWLHAREFQYCGNVGLHFPTSIDWSGVTALATRIPRAVPLTGVWGVDFINRSGRVYLLEVNPRYTASFEVFEFRKGVPFLSHFSSPRVPRWKQTPGPRTVVGKAIYYAPRRLTVPASGPWDASLAHCTDVWRRPDFADIPHAGDVIEMGQPVCTLLTEAGSEEACEAGLRERAAALDRLFG